MPGVATAVQRAALSTVLISMPFQESRRPSIQLGLLKAIGSGAGFPVATCHACLDFAALVGERLYAALADHRGRLVGDWLFSVAAFGDAAPDPEGRLLADFAADLRHLDPADLDRLPDIRARLVPTYLDGLVETDLWRHVRVVGFTSTFQQNTASFALARRLKERFPHLVTVFGGANFDAEMGREWVRAFDCIDVAISGEADDAFPALLDALATGADPAGIPGVLRRGAAADGSSPSAPPIASLDELPCPDYAEYFARRKLLWRQDRTGEVVVPFESGRGCWWGAKHHCTFCGLNGTSLTWRAKSPARVLDELALQAERHGVSRFAAVDNILDPRYPSDLMPALVESAPGYELFYEVKANLDRHELAVLARAGVRHVQPGIESLSSAVLRLMRKGVRSGQNVNFLRWAQHLGITASWNLLWGFPGETEEDYRRQAEVVPHLVHLRPPESAGRVWLERFSPMFADREQFPTRYRRPEASYGYVYPAHVDLDRAAYFFEYAFDDALPDPAYEPLHRAVVAWAAAWDAPVPPRLTYRAEPGLLQIDDHRRPDRTVAHAFEGPRADLYLALGERPRTLAAVHRELGLGEPLGWLGEVLEGWRDQGLVFVDEDRVLALALPAASEQ